jgi:outer membrane protein assembly factor BamD
MILQYPDSKLVPEAKQRLLEVQEVLGEREFEIGRFYYLRESYPASIARLQSLVDKYPLYSRADEALYLLGQDYEGQITRMRSAPTCDAHGMPRGCATEGLKARYIAELTKHAGEAYDKILTRYPMMDRSDDAKKRLTALHQSIPRPTKAAVAQNKAEIASRSEATTVQKMMGLIKKGPDVAKASKVGDPSLADPEVVSATSVVSKENMGALGLGEKSVGVEIINPNHPPTDSSAPPSDGAPAGASPFGNTAAAGTQPLAPDPNELKPNAPADPNELKPTDTAGADQALPPPPQVNEIHQGESSSSTSASASSADTTLASDKDLSSSKKKRKKGLQKINPF